MGAPASGPFVSVVIPARNEERSIEKTVRAMLAQTYRDLEVLVVDDRSTDSTGAILAAIAREEPRLIVIGGEETPPGWLGKPWALQQGSLCARGELLLFVDADIYYAPEAIASAVEELRADGASMLTFLPNIEMRGFWENVGMPQLPLVAFGLIPTFLANRTTLPRLGIGGGTGNLVTRAAYDHTGGHEALRNAVVDDVGLARLLRRSGFRTIAVRAEHLTSVRMYHGGRELVEGFTKNTFAVFGRSFVLTIVVTALGFLFHLWPFVAALMGDSLAIATVALITLTRLVILGTFRHSILAALLGHPPMMLLWAWISLRSMWVTGIRRSLTWRGRVYDASRTRFGADR